MNTINRFLTNVLSYLSRRRVVTGIQGCQVRYKIITRVLVALGKPQEGKDEGSCLLLIIES